MNATYRPSADTDGWVPGNGVPRAFSVIHVASPSRRSQRPMNWRTTGAEIVLFGMGGW